MGWIFRKENPSSLSSSFIIATNQQLTALPSVMDD